VRGKSSNFHLNPENLLTPFPFAGTFSSQGSCSKPMSTEQKYLAIRKGLLEFVILKIISGDKVYVADMLQILSDTEFSTQEGTLYPLLSRMRREELVAYEWQESESGPPRKYYKLTAAGKKQLSDFNDYWKSLNTFLNQLGK